MLTKLIKHEWKFFWKVPAAINLCLIILSLLGIAFLASPLLTLDYDWIDAIAVSGFLVYYLAIMAGSLGVLIYSAIRYYKNIYTDEGYLTNTLPVTPRQTILSKLSVSVIWNFITSVVICVCVCMLLAFALTTYGDTNIWYEISHLWKELIDTLGGGFQFFLFLLSVILLVLSSPFFSLTMLYSSISLGQLFKKHKVAGAVIWYIGEYIILQFVTSVLMNIPLFEGLLAIESSKVSPLGVINTFMYGMLIFIIIGAAALYFLTEYMLKNKLNLE